MKTFPLRLSDEQHKDLKDKAHKADKSLHKYILDCIARVPIDVQAKRLGRQILGEDYQTNEFIEEVKNRPENQKPYDPEKEQDKLLKKIMKEVEKPETQCYHEGPSDCVDSCKPGTPKTLAGDVVTIEEVDNFNPTTTTIVKNNLVNFTSITKEQSARKSKFKKK